MLNSFVIMGILIIFAAVNQNITVMDKKLLKTILEILKYIISALIGYLTGANVGF